MKTILAFLTTILLLTATTFAADFQPVTCEGSYPHHLQGVCTDENDSIVWSFTTKLVKTDRSGKVVKQVDVANHHGDLCFHGGKVYVALNVGKFNDPKGNADSWVYVWPTRGSSARPRSTWGSATAILDRFLHHSEVIQITGKSYRLVNREKGPKDTKAPTGSTADK